MTKGERIKQARLEKGLTQEELAKLCNTTKQTINKYEKNIVTNIPSDRIEQLCEKLEVTPEYIMGWKSNADHVTDDGLIIEVMNRVSKMDKRRIPILLAYMDLLNNMEK